VNEQAALALYEAERRGVRQVRGKLADYEGGMCAAEVLIRANLYSDRLAEVRTMLVCPLCGKTRFLIIHLNDDHGLTFSEIARKLGPDSA
jgi:hypothetical protein